MDTPSRACLGSVNLKTGVIPVSKAAATLSELIKRAQQNEPIIVTQNGYPAAAILDIDSYTTLRELAEKYLISQDIADPSSADQPDPPMEREANGDI
jgi:prevent-host-death family protein